MTRGRIQGLRVGRRLAALLTGVLLGVLATFVLVALQGVRPAEYGQDFFFLRSVAARWLSEGWLYTPEQLAGPWNNRTFVDFLYPPSALIVLVPFVFLPAILWWVIPAAVIGYCIREWRPAPWTWPVLVLLLIWPRSIGAVLFGTTDMWIAAGVAAGLRFGWPAVLLTLKPSLGPLALIGVRQRSFWIAALVLGIAMLPLAPLWIQYITSIRNAAGLGLDYSLGVLPLVGFPFVAWLGRSAEPVVDQRPDPVDQVLPDAAASPAR